MVEKTKSMERPRKSEEDFQKSRPVVNEKTEAQKCEVTCPRSHSQAAVDKRSRTFLSNHQGGRKEEWQGPRKPITHGACATEAGSWQGLPVCAAP